MVLLHAWFQTIIDMFSLVCTAFKSLVTACATLSALLILALTSVKHAVREMQELYAGNFAHFISEDVCVSNCR